MVLGVRSSYRPAPRPPVEMAWDRQDRPGLVVIDSDARFRADLAAGLVSQGWRVWGAADGTAGLEVFLRNRGEIAAALVDFEFPGLEGGRVLAELGELSPDLVRCATATNLSAYATAAFRQLSDLPLFTKPLSAPALAFTLFEMVNPVTRR